MALYGPDDASLAEVSSADQRGASSPLAERLAAMESEAHATRSDLERLVVVVESLARDFHEFARRSGRPNVGALIAFAGVLIAFVAAIGSPYVSRQERDRSRLDETEGRIVELLRSSAVHEVRTVELTRRVEDFEAELNVRGPQIARNSDASKLLREAVKEVADDAERMGRELATVLERLKKGGTDAD